MSKLALIGCIGSTLMLTLHALPEPSVVNLSNKVIKQEGNTCGFHAVKNAGWALKWARKKITKETFLEAISAEPDTEEFPLAVCQVGAGQLDDLSDEQMAQVARDMGMPLRDVSVIGNIKEFNPALMSDEQFASLENTLRAIQAGRSFAHAFVLGSMGHMQRSGESIKATYGHWVAVVVQSISTSKLNIYYMDSLGNQINKDILDGLVKLLETPVTILNIKRTYEQNIASAEATATQRNIDSCLYHLNRIPSNIAIKDIVAAFGKDQIQRILYTLIRISKPESAERKRITTELNRWFAFAFQKGWFTPPENQPRSRSNKQLVYNANQPAIVPKDKQGTLTLEQVYPFDLENKDAHPIWVKIANSGKLLVPITQINHGESLRIDNTIFRNYRLSSSFQKPTQIWIFKKQPDEKQFDKAFTSYFLDENTKESFKKGVEGQPEYQTIYLKWENDLLQPRVGSFFRKRTPSGLSIANNIPASYIHKGE